MKSWIGALMVLLPLAVGSCKVPIFGVNAGFTKADASWFEEEQTLFVFYEVTAEQGLGEPSVIEVTYVTDDVRLDWTPIEDLPTVHTHMDVDCGPNARCGSTSLHVPIEPRSVGVRLRYHKDGELALEPRTVFNVVGPGPPHSNRSLTIYGVFDESNSRIQWRGRHNFPTVRNQRATELGLRRQFVVSEPRFGNAQGPAADNPYAYGVTCPTSFTAMDLVDIGTSQRAIFHPDALPLGASDASLVCGTSTVTDALGEFSTGAVARKNPEVRGAFPVLASPVRDATPVPFFLAPCDRNISNKHAKMQRQRLFLDGVPTTCTDDWASPNFVDELVVLFRDAVEAERPAGRDLVLVIAVHQDEDGVVDAVEEALARVVPQERHRTSPHLSGAFVFDSTSHGLTDPELSPVVLWCPATISTTDLPDASVRSCATLPDIPDLNLGPFSFGALQILPTRDQYLDFLEDYSDAQAGNVTSLEFLAPEFATTTDHVDLGEFGVVTFLNNETIAADPDDAFSYCTPGEGPQFMLRTPVMSNPNLSYALLYACYYGELPEEVCAVAEIGLLPIEGLPEWHNVFGESEYEIGLFWEFPFLLRMEYEAFLAGSVSAFGLSVPFGLGAPAEGFYGSQVWLDEEFAIDPALTQCKRFCDHPTFDSAGVYHINDPFRTTYPNTCYVPLYPVPPGEGFPLDP